MIVFSASVPILSIFLAVVFAVPLLGLLFWVWKEFSLLIFKKIAGFFKSPKNK